MQCLKFIREKIQMNCVFYNVKKADSQFPTEHTGAKPVTDVRGNLPRGNFCGALTKDAAHHSSHGSETRSSPQLQFRVASGASGHAMHEIDQKVSSEAGHTMKEMIQTTKPESFSAC
jgi:hypothetical protein